MTEYDGNPRRLSWDLQRALVFSRTTPEDADCEASSFVWPEDSDEQVVIPFKLSLNEYNVLASAIDVGSDIAFGVDAIRVVDLWLRNMRCEVKMCGCCPDPAPSFNDRLASQTYITNTTNEYGDVYNTWNTAGQTVSSIAPDLDHSTGDPVDIDKVICLALEMLMIAIIESAKANKSGTEQQNRDMVKNLGNVMGALGTAGGAALAAGGSAAALVGFLGGPYLVLGLALAGVGLSIANLIWTTPGSVLDNEVAVQDVLCVIKQNMRGATPNRGLFISALVGGDFTPGSDQAQIADIVRPYLNDLSVYLQFLSTTQGLYEVADFGVLPECGCDTDENCFYPNWLYYHAGDSTIQQQTATFIDIPLYHGSVWAWEAGDTTRTNFCRFTGFSVLEGTFTGIGPYAGFVAWTPGGGTTSDQNYEGDVCLMSFLSSTECILRVYVR